MNAIHKPSFERLLMADEIEIELYQVLACSERLRKFFLKRAFEGRLVEQLPEDGDASDLLRKIKDQYSKQLRLL